MSRRTRKASLLAAGLALIVLVDVLWRQADRRDAPLIPPDSNLLVITIDTLRADRLSPYGYDNAYTPAAARLAREGVLFRSAYTPVPLTLPAHASLFTGLQPFTHGVRDNASVLSEEAVTLAEVFAREGYATGGFVGAFVLDSRWGLARGFDHYFDDFVVPAAERVAMASIQRPADEVWEAAKPWLQDNAQRRFFLWLHFFDPHSPYCPPEPFASRFAKEPYDGEIAYADSVVDKILNELEQSGLLERTVVALLSDHGEGLGEHGESEHGLLTYDSTLRVPWIMRLPGGEASGAEIELPVGLVDVFPTLLDLFGFHVSGPIDGTSRLNQLRNPSSGRPGVLYAESLYPRLHFGWSELLSIRTEQFKYIRAPQPQLYDYVADPNETRNLAVGRAETVARLERMLTELAEGWDSEPYATTVDGAAQGALRALGYVAGSAMVDFSASGEALPDPTEKITTFERLLEARRLLYAGNDREGVALLHTLLDEDPDFVQAHQSLREHYIQQGEFRAAEAQFRAGLTRHDDKMPWLVSLGSIYRAWERPEAALDAYREALALDPVHIDALLAAAEIERDRRNFSEAREYLRRARDVSMDTGSVDVRTAQLYVYQGRPGEAEQLLRGVIAAHPRHPEANYLLAVIAEARGDARSAEAAYRREITINSSNFRAKFNLAMLLGRRGAHADQIVLLESIPAIAPDFHEVWFYLAKAYLDLGEPARLADAVAAAQEGLRKAPTAASAPLGHYVLADVYSIQGRLAESREQLRRGQALEARLRERR
jgi:arylsulfatase A-like enzyme/Tfp pilus assembly protein PilF